MDMLGKRNHCTQTTVNRIRESEPRYVVVTVYSSIMIGALEMVQQRVECM